MDRLTRHVHILEMNGESYHLKQSKRNEAHSLTADPPTAPYLLQRTCLGEENVFRSGPDASPCRRLRPPLQTSSSPTIPGLLLTVLVYFYSSTVVWFNSALDTHSKPYSHQLKPNLHMPRPARNYGVNRGSCRG